MGYLKDFATADIITPPSPASSGTSLVVDSGQGARLPAVPFLAVVHPASEAPTLDNAEKIRVTAKSTDTLTIVRAQGDTTAKSIAAGWKLSNSLFLEDINGVQVTVTTAAATAAKVGTTTQGNYTPVEGDKIVVSFTLGCNVNTPTLNIDGSGANNIRVSQANVTTNEIGIASAVKVPMWYDGTYWQLYGVQKNTDTNTTYAEISTAEIDAGTATGLKTITGRRTAYILDKAVRSTSTRTLTAGGTTPGSPVTGDVWINTGAELGKNGAVIGEVPTGTVNGTNKVFYTSQPYVPGSLEVAVNGLIQKRVTHVVETDPTSGTFTFDDAPLTGDLLTINYWYISTTTGNADTVDGYHASLTPTANTIPVLDSNAKLPVSSIPNISFFAYPASTQTIASGGAKVDYGNADFNYGSGYSASTSTFTAPVAGIYHFDATLYNSTGTAADMLIRLNLGGSRSASLRGNWITSGGYRAAVGSWTVKLQANDTVSIFGYTGSGNIVGANNIEMSFSGFLYSAI